MWAVGSKGIRSMRVSLDLVDFRPLSLRLEPRGSMDDLSGPDSMIVVCRRSHVCFERLIPKNRVLPGTCVRQCTTGGIGFLQTFDCRSAGWTS